MSEILSPEGWDVEMRQCIDECIEQAGLDARLRAHDAAIRAENKRLAEALREIDARTGHFGEAPPPPEWMPMLSLIAWVGRTARAALAEHRDAKGTEAGR